MSLRRGMWAVKVTHVPSGESVTLTSEFHRSHRAAKDMAIKIIKARLAMKKMTSNRRTK